MKADNQKGLPRTELAGEPWSLAYAPPRGGTCVGAKYTGLDIAGDECQQVTLDLDYEGKRDRWNGYDPSEHKRIFEEYQRLEEARKIAKAKKLEEKLAKATEGSGGQEEPAASAAKPSLDDDGDFDAEDGDKYGDELDMPGQKFDSKQRQSIRNLRIREDTAKYLFNLDPNSAYYDSKTRAMRGNPFENSGKPESEVPFAGDNFVRYDGDVQDMIDRQVFAWEMHDKLGLDVHLQECCVDLGVWIASLIVEVSSALVVWRDIRLSTKGRVFCTAVRSVLLYGSETWLVRVEDIGRLLVFDHRCLRNIARISWDHRVSNTVVRKRVLGKDGKSIDEMKLHQLRWLGHVLRMPNHRLPRRGHQLRWLRHVLRMPNDRLPRRAMFSGIGADPTRLELLAKKVSKAKCDVQNKVRAEILERYGGHEHLESIPKELILGQWESYAEYSPTGRMIRGAEKPTVKSRYEEDVFNNNHTSVWGSYWFNGQWGYRCCHSLIKESYCLGEKSKETSFPEVPDGPTAVALLKPPPMPTDADTNFDNKANLENNTNRNVLKHKKRKHARSKSGSSSSSSSSSGSSSDSSEEGIVDCINENDHLRETVMEQSRSRFGSDKEIEEHPTDTKTIENRNKELARSEARRERIRVQRADKKKKRKDHLKKSSKNKHKRKRNESSSSSSAESVEGIEEVQERLIQEAIRKERERLKAVDEYLAMDERKRPYNSLADVKAPTAEEMEAYYRTKVNRDDPMSHFV
ncbi:unnamed protein product [Schistosoma mattheei]|uniref:Pre-mRNA-splicing factor SLU7 n=2 Tax=Schistosoma mattheei TaxID=31246 RepID=A0A3P8JQ26_9TREM|nr:unnamed protein product [Schistosoma mattheei]